MSQKLLFDSCIWLSLLFLYHCRVDEWQHVACNEEHKPHNCDFGKMDLVTVDDYDRCGPAKLTLNARKLFLGAAGRGITYKRNKDAFDEIKIIPKMLRDVSTNCLQTSALGLNVDFPIGVSPTALHKLAHPDGEMATVSGLSRMRTIMIVSIYASTKLDDVGRFALGTFLHLWMQTYIFENRSKTVEIVRNAENSGFKGIVVTADSPRYATLTCDFWNKGKLPTGTRIENLKNDNTTAVSPAATFKDIRWLKTITKLPIIVKGLLSGEDAVQAVLAGASAILVSNQGGRQMDGAPATIDALPGVVAAVNKLYPRREVYMDSGVRSGHDVYKAIARGAKMVFVGRPIIWGLALGGAAGVTAVMNTLVREFNETMLLAGSSYVKEIREDTILSQIPLPK